MPRFAPADATVHEMHGSRFHSFVSPSRGSSQLCAWRVDVAGGSTGAEHTVSHEEVFLVLSGRASLTLDGERHDLVAGMVAVAPAGSSVRLDNGTREAASLWVTTSAGLTARTPSGDEIVPPWTH